MNRRPAVFLDKDGTLLEDRPFNVDPRRIRPAPGASEALRLLGHAGLPLFVVSNQPGVALGRFDESRLDAVGDWLRQWFADCGARLEGFAWCPHAPAPDTSPACACRKPAPGLLRTLARRHTIDLRRSWMVGDILDDVEAGARAGCRTVLLDNGHETLWRGGPWRQPELRAPGLLEAVRRLLAQPARDAAA